MGGVAACRTGGVQRPLVVVLAALFEQVRAVRKHSGAKPGQPCSLTGDMPRYIKERLAEQIEASIEACAISAFAFVGTWVLREGTFGYADIGARIVCCR